jgi:hypothetical protein
MARVSFSLRPTSGGVLRVAQGAGDHDDGLKSSGMQLSPATALSSAELFFSASSTCYGEMGVTWAVPISALAATPVVTQSIVVYSRYGPPETVSSGLIVGQEPAFPGQNLSSDSFNSIVLDGLTEGEFAYFSLFVLYQSTGGDEYYEKAAEVYEMVPQNFGSTMSLWSRIPEFYQNLDRANGQVVAASDSHCLGFDPEDQPVGPLLRFLSVFGFEMDRDLTLIQHTTRAKNPEYADPQSADALAYEMGTVLNGGDLGVARLRTLLHDIGNFRRVKGTQGGMEFFLRSLSGSTAVVNPVTRVIDVHAQRVNHILDPKNSGNLVVATRSAADDEATHPGPPAGNDQYPASFNGYAFSDTPPTSAGGTVYQITSPVEVVDGDLLMFSVHGDYGYELIKWARTVDSTTGVVYDFCVHDATPLSPTPGIPRPTIYGDRRYFAVPVTSTAMGATSATVTIEFMVAPGAFDSRQFLLEKNSVGSFFDGDLVLGGWMVDSSASVSDYRWEGTANNSRSLYNEDYERTKKVLLDLYQDVLPVDVAATFTTVNYNVI